MSDSSIIISAFPYRIGALYSSRPSYAWPLGYLIAIGELKLSRANSSIAESSLPFLGAITVMFGIEVRNERSNIPWCVSPSLPTSPALSIANTTWRCWIHTSWSIWSYALCKNEEYTANTGLRPPAAIPAENVTAFSSAIPTSKNLSGNHLENLLSPVTSGIAAVTATIDLSFLASWHIFSENTSE